MRKTYGNAVNALLWNRMSRTYTRNHIDYKQLLEPCIRSKSLKQGKTIHQHFLKNTTGKKNAALLDKLAQLYISCSKLELACYVFNEIPEPEKKVNVLLWNQMIRAYAWEGPFGRAIELYDVMVESGVNPNKYTFPFVLKACSRLQAVEDGRRIHGEARSYGLENDVYVCTALVDFYAKCGCLDEARDVFDGMPSKDAVAWNAMIACFSLHGLSSEAIKLFIQMQDSGLSPNPSTIVGVLPAVGGAKELCHGKTLHSYSLRRGFLGDVVVATGLLDMYGKCQCLGYAKRVFDNMGNRNEVTWSAMIGAYMSCDCAHGALDLCNHMLFKYGISPSQAILASIIRACTKLADVSRGRRIHGYMIKSGFVCNVMVGNTLLSMYSKCGMIEDTVRLFKEMDSNDLVSYNAIISGYTQSGKAEEALDIIQKMQSLGIDPDLATMVGLLPACAQLAAIQHGACCHSSSIVRGFTDDTSICNALIDMYSKCGRIDTARLVFDKMPAKDIVSWNAMIFAYGIHGLGKESVLLFEIMQSESVKPDDVTFICLLSACSHSGLVDEGKKCFVAMDKDFLIYPRMEHYICMVDLLGRVGLLDEAWTFIKQMPFSPDTRVWSSLLAACRVHKNVALSEEISNKIHSTGFESTGNFVLMSNIYSAAGRWDDAAQVRITQKNMGFDKIPGCSWIEVKGVVHSFVGGDRTDPHSTEINRKLEELQMEMKKLGYCSEPSFVLQDVEEEEKERILLHHSEKLAVAFGLLALNPNKPIVITKNLRICVDCHAALKYMTIITKREITVRDVSRFHHFKDGTCNCCDFW